MKKFFYLSFIVVTLFFPVLFSSVEEKIIIPKIKEPNNEIIKEKEEQVKFTSQFVSLLQT